MEVDDFSGKRIDSRFASFSRNSSVHEFSILNFQFSICFRLQIPLRPPHLLCCPCDSPVGRKFPREKTFPRTPHLWRDHFTLRHHHILSPSRFFHRSWIQRSA